MKTALMNATTYDNLYTPAPIAEQFADFYLSYYAQVTRRPLRTVWECTDMTGESAITRAFESRGVEVIPYAGDFLSADVACDAIVTNPPYSLKNAFLERVFTLGKPFAFLLPLTALGTKRRSDLFRLFGGGLRIAVIPQRVDFTGKSANWFDVGWFFWFDDTVQQIFWLPEPPVSAGVDALRLIPQVLCYENSLDN